MDDIRYPEEIILADIELRLHRQQVDAWEGLLRLIRAEAEKGRVYGHFV